MADVKVVHLCSVHVDMNCELRFVNVGPSSGFKTTLPLFLGSDLLSDAKVIQTNHCRIHARYGKKGMATKLYFPSDVSIGGISNCQSGAWFYTVQGAFQVVFEYHSRPKQLKIVEALLDLWKSEAAFSAHLPEKLQLSIEQLCGLDCGVSSDPSCLSHLLARCDLESSTSSRDETLTIISENRVIIEADEPEELETTERQQVDAASGDSLSCLCDELLYRARLFANKCRQEQRQQRQLSSSLVSFLKLVKLAASKSGSIENEMFVSFAELITDYSALLSDQTRLHSFGTDDSWTEVFDAPQHALLCLVGEWLGKYMSQFSDAVLTKVAAFKVRSLLADMPPASELIGELFPKCMRLLIGFWIGLYGPPEMPFSARKPPMTSRDDHSYYLSQTCETVTTKSASNRADHSYSSAPASPSESAPTHLPIVPPRKDHTYVAPTPKIDTTESPPVSGTREDHTYVSTKERSKLKTPPPPDLVEDGLPHAKRFKTAAASTATWAVVKPHKYPFILLILEFLNDALVSGVAHVVYTRLLTHPVNNNYY